MKRILVHYMREVLSFILSGMLRPVIWLLLTDSRDGGGGGEAAAFRKGRVELLPDLQNSGKVVLTDGVKTFYTEIVNLCETWSADEIYAASVKEGGRT